MKRIFLGAAILILGYMMIVLLMAMPAGATPINDNQFRRVHPDTLHRVFDNGELLPIDPLLPWAEWCWVEPENGPQEVTFGKNVWVLEDRVEWKNIMEGFDFFYWGHGLFYRYFDNAEFAFYTFETGVTRYPPHSQTPLPPSVWLLGTGLICAGIFKGRRGK